MLKFDRGKAQFEPSHCHPSITPLATKLTKGNLKLNTKSSARRMSWLRVLCAGLRFYRKYGIRPKVKKFCIKGYRVYLKGGDVKNTNN